MTFFSSQISPQSLHLSPTAKHLLEEQNISYPTHVSGLKMVQGLQRYNDKVKWDCLAGQGGGVHGDSLID